MHPNRTIHDYSIQEIFNGVVSHLRNQGRRSVTVWGVPAADSADGCRCAKAFVRSDLKVREIMSLTGSLPSHKFDAKTEKYKDSSIGYCRDYAPDFTKPMAKLHLLNALEYVHDCTEVYEWEVGFAEIAKIFNLDNSLLEDKDTALADIAIDKVLDKVTE